MNSRLQFSIWIGILAFFMSCSPTTEKNTAQHENSVVKSELCIDKYMDFSGENEVSLRVNYIGCACGPEYPQFNIDSVIYSENVESYYYLNKEISLDFKNDEHEMEFTTLQDSCSTKCIRYLVNGNIKSNGYGMHQLNIAGFEAIID